MSKVRKRRLSRLELMQEMLDDLGSSSHPSINIGCKKTSMGDVKLDISGRPDVRGTALYLPFRPNIFSAAIFTEVMEHLPQGTEARAIGEISRILKDDGRLILSTPSAQGPWGILYWLSDPAFWLVLHRHYREGTLRNLLNSGSLSIEVFSRRGGPQDLLFSLVTPFLYLLRRLGHSWDPDLGSDYSRDASTWGYTFVVRARKGGPNGQDL